MVKIPRILIAGTHSGVGKTSITRGIVSALTARGLRVQTFKVGPDYLDPTHLAEASHRPCYNLDHWMMNREQILACFTSACADADIAVIEGVMGLFDGSSTTTNHASSAEMAQILSCPIILIADAAGTSRGLAATIHGFHTFCKETSIAAVIANRCGSLRHAEGIDQSLLAANLPPLIGAVLNQALPALPSRHLGLHPADHKAKTITDQLASVIESSVQLDQLIALSQSAPNLPTAHSAKPSPIVKKIRIGIVQDEALFFYYQENIETLKSLGCEIEPFSILHGSQLPVDLDAIYLGGGYPELHADTLSNNHSLLQAIREFAAAGKPIYGECGGLMVLSNSITDLSGNRYPMLGLLPFDTVMSEQLQALGYVTASHNDTSDSTQESNLRGHVFHYSKILQSPPPCETRIKLTSARGHIQQAEGYCHGSVMASYAHLYFPSNLPFIKRLIQSLD